LSAGRDRYRRNSRGWGRGVKWGVEESASETRFAVNVLNLISSLYPPETRKKRDPGGGRRGTSLKEKGWVIFLGGKTSASSRLRQVLGPLGENNNHWGSTRGGAKERLLKKNLTVGQTKSATPETRKRRQDKEHLRLILP